MTSRRRILATTQRLGDLFMLAVSFLFALAITGYLGSDGSLAEFLSIRVKVGNILMFLGFALCWMGIFEAFGLYRSRRISPLLALWWDVLKATVMGTLLLPAVSMVLSLEAVDRTFVLAFFAAAFLSTGLARTWIRFALGEARRQGRNLRNLVIVGAGPRGARVGQDMRQRPDLGYLLLGFVDDLPAPRNPGDQAEKLLGGLGEIEELLTTLQVDEVLIALPLKSHYAQIEQIIDICEDLGITIRMPADFFHLEVASSEVDYLDGSPIMTLKTPTPSLSGLMVKRLLDVACSLAGLLALAPIFLSAAIAVKATSRGPIFFSQERVGFGRRSFKMYKFRTMVTNAEELLAELEASNEVEGAAFKMKEDPRITKVGRVLRKFSIDELPQLWNVLVGQMSIVGPRPLPLRDVQAFDRRWQNRRFSVKPGLTCLWQANGRHNIGFDEWMELDLQYIDQWSLGLDFEIILKTVPAVLRGTGAS